MSVYFFIDHIAQRDDDLTQQSFLFPELHGTKKINMSIIIRANPQGITSTFQYKIDRKWYVDSIHFLYERLTLVLHLIMAIDGVARFFPAAQSFFP